MSKKRGKELTKRAIQTQYGIPESLLRKYLPAPRMVKNRDYKSAEAVPMWREEDIRYAIRYIPEFKRAYQRKEDKRKKQSRKSEDAIRFLEQFSPEMLFAAGSELTRHFVLHVGPTNSGKTYQALQALKAAENGVYLGPLRLLALEVAENLNADGCPCSLLTGEESIDVPGAEKTASTIELCNYQEHYQVAVIDEAQLIEDHFRGPHWARAISLVDADEVHICLAPKAEPFMRSIAERMDPAYEVVYHERLVPLEYKGLFRDISQVQPGDALIAFSRKKVLQIAAELEQKGILASVIYGALPPASRREEVRRFSEKETSVVVATDAIGMGISLPIRRVIFTETEKFDGIRGRSLNRSEIKQIAGRAGRFGKYDLGEVLTMSDPRRIAEALREGERPLEKLTIGFPAEALDYNRPLKEMLNCWDTLPKNDLFMREDMRDAEFLLAKLGKLPDSIPKTQIFEFITCPLDIKKSELVEYWRQCCMHILYGENVLKPYFPEDSLENCELQYHAYDIYHQLLRRIGLEDDCMQEKIELSEKINEFLKQEKSHFLKRCKICGKEMSIYDRFSICDECYAKENVW